MDKHCDYCGKLFTTNLKVRRFCDIKCKRKKRMANVRGEAVSSLGGCCVKCGITDQDVLHIDHIKPISLLRESRVKNRKTFYISVKSQLSKFQLLCANCHLKKTNMEKMAGLYHYRQPWK